MHSELWSVNRAAEELERDRRAIRKAMRAVAPDGRDRHGRPRWRLAAIVSALAASDGVHGNAGKSEIDRLAAQIEDTAQAVDRMLKLLQAEPDITIRRKILEDRGAVVGELDRLMKRANSSLPAADRPLAETFCDVMMQNIVNEVMELCEFVLTEASDAA